MADTERNKQTVARVFDALRAGDVDALDELIVTDYVQHNPLADNGLKAVKEFFTGLGPLEVDVYRVLTDGDFAVTHSHYKSLNLAGIDIWRFDNNGKIVEHWDTLQEIPETTANGNDMFSQLTH